MRQATSTAALLVLGLQTMALWWQRDTSCISGGAVSASNRALIGTPLLHHHAIRETWS